MLTNSSHIRLFLIIISLFQIISLYGQYSPAAGQSGSDAINKNDSHFKEWAKECHVVRGYIQMSDTSVVYTQGNITSNRAFFGTEQIAVGKPKGGLEVVSLGDKGTATLTFEHPIINGNGPDFAVFENAIQEADPPYQYFIELAFVEVSSDGIHFVRFPSVSLTPTNNQVGSFGQVDPTKIYNLAGKYTADYGTPFDLDELKDSATIDLKHITHVRIIDVGGDINPKFASYDSKGNIINDPYPTPFWNCGFDLQALGVLNMAEDALFVPTINQSSLGIYPNPAISNGEIFISIPENDTQSLSIMDINGKLVFENTHFNPTESITIPSLSSGLYVVTVRSNHQLYRNKLVIKN